jgi:hypothetical protein
LVESSEAQKNLIINKYRQLMGVYPQVLTGLQKIGRKRTQNPYCYHALEVEDEYGSKWISPIPIIAEERY